MQIPFNRGKGPSPGLSPDYRGEEQGPSPDPLPEYRARESDGGLPTTGAVRPTEPAISIARTPAATLHFTASLSAVRPHPFTPREVPPMSSIQSSIGQVVENADIDRDTPQPEIHVEERRLSLHDFLKTAVKINGSDIHLQAG